MRESAILNSKYAQLCTELGDIVTKLQILESKKTKILQQIEALDQLAPLFSQQITRSESKNEQKKD